MSDRISTILEKLIDRIIRERNEVIAENEKLRDEIERLQAERRWIPVSERLPEEGVEVLVFDEHKDYLTDEIYHWQDGDIDWMNDDDGVTHWMPLPEPPEEK